jgi:hypothetical protein
MTKFKEYYKRMVEENKEMFDSFAQLHMDYSMDEDKFQNQFNKDGEIILKVIHEWENKLCSQSEKAGYSNYTGGLSEKFQAEVRSHFPLIDHIGIIVTPKKSAPEITLKRVNLSPVPAFNLKKIRL